MTTDFSPVELAPLDPPEPTLAAPPSPFDHLFASVAFWAEMARQAEAHAPDAPAEWRVPLTQLAAAARDLVLLTELERVPWRVRDRMLARMRRERAASPAGLLYRGSERVAVAAAMVDRPVEEVTARLGVSPKTIATACRAAGRVDLARRFDRASRDGSGAHRPSYDEAGIAEALQEPGATLKGVARRYGCSEHVVARVRRESAAAKGGPS